jgi:hypothetical protein
MSPRCVDDSRNPYPTVVQVEQFHAKVVGMEDRKSSQKKKQKKKERDLGKPKRPLSAYNFFFQSEREKILRSVPERVEGKPRRSHGKIGFAPLARMIAERWNSIDIQERTMYDARAAEDKIRYFRELEEWTNNKKSDSSSSMLDDNDEHGTIHYPTSGGTEDSSEAKRLPARREFENTSAGGLPSSTAIAPRITIEPRRDGDSRTSLLLPMVAARMPAGTMLRAGDYTTFPPVAGRHLLLPNTLGIAPDGSFLSGPGSCKDSSSLKSIGTLSPPPGASANLAITRRAFIDKLVDRLDAESIDFLIGLFRP